MPRAATRCGAILLRRGTGLSASSPPHPASRDALGLSAAIPFALRGSCGIRRRHPLWVKQQKTATSGRCFQNSLGLYSGGVFLRRSP